MFIILYGVYHDYGNIDSHVFPTKEAAAEYIKALPRDAEVLPDGSDTSATIYEVGADELTKVESWYLSALHWDLPEGQPMWVQGYEAYRETEALERSLTPPVVRSASDQLGYTRWLNDKASE